MWRKRIEAPHLTAKPFSQAGFAFVSENGGWTYYIIMYNIPSSRSLDLLFLLCRLLIVDLSLCLIIKKELIIAIGYTVRVQAKSGLFMLEVKEKGTFSLIDEPKDTNANSESR
jgi:hypothetical protein